MAKRKTPKIKDLRPEKITDIQLNNVQSCVRTMDQLTMNAGRLEVQKHALLTSLQTIQTDLDNLRGEFIKQYGTDNINIEDGSIVYPEQSNSKEDGEANKED